MHSNKKIISVWTRDDSHIIVYRHGYKGNIVFEIPCCLYGDTDVVSRVSTNKNYVTVSESSSYNVIVGLVRMGFKKSNELADKYNLVSKLSK